MFLVSTLNAAAVVVQLRTRGLCSYTAAFVPQLLNCSIILVPGTWYDIPGTRYIVYVRTYDMHVRRDVRSRWIAAIAAGYKIWYLVRVVGGAEARPQYPQ